MKTRKLAIVGATGLVGQKVLKVLWEEGLLKVFKVFLIASEKNAGRCYLFKGDVYNILPLNEKCLNFNFDVVIFSAGDDISRDWVQKFAERGASVIDNTNAFRRIKNIPLVVPEINADIIKKENKIISNPNCSTIELAVAIHRFLKVCDIEKIIVSTYQSVSGAGKLALIDYKNDTNFYFKKGIKNNVIPAIGEIENNGFCKEENKIMFELNKILNKQIDVFAMSVRVPIEYCHGESVYIKFKESVNFENLKKVLKANHIVFSEDELFLTKECTESNKTYVCRLRTCSETEVMFFVVADNLRRGAAYNAVEIVKVLLEKDFI